MNVWSYLLPEFSNVVCSEGKKERFEKRFESTSTNIVIFFL